MEEDGGGSLILFVYPIIFTNDGVNIMLMYTADTFPLQRTKKTHTILNALKKKKKLSSAFSFLCNTLLASCVIQNISSLLPTQVILICTVVCLLEATTILPQRK